MFQLSCGPCTKQNGQVCAFSLLVRTRIACVSLEELCVIYIQVPLHTLTHTLTHRQSSKDLCLFRVYILYIIYICVSTDVHFIEILYLYILFRYGVCVCLFPEYRRCYKYIYNNTTTDVVKRFFIIIIITIIFYKQICFPLPLLLFRGDIYIIIFRSRTL